jgi:hypothetical protein
MVTDRTGVHRPLTNLADVTPGVGLPLSKIATIAGTAGALHTQFGVLVSQNESLALYGEDLASRHWLLPLPKRAELVRWDDNVLLGPVDGNLLEIDIRTGHVSRRLPCTIEGWVRVSDGRVIVVAGANKIVCVSAADGRLAWEHDWLVPHLAYADGRLYLRRDLSDELTCVDIESGACLWAFRASPEGSGGKDDRSHVIFDFGVLPDYVVVVTRNGRVFQLEPLTGRPIAVGRPEVLGLPLVTRQSVFFKSPDGLMEYSHSTLQEISRLQYGAELRKIWKKPLPAVNAYCVTREAVIWTTMAGVMFGVDRRQPNGSRTCWLDDLEALMPTYQPPFVGGSHLYYEPKRGRAGLVCYTSRWV